MKTILESYKNINGEKLESTYTVENTFGDKLKVKEVEKYSPKREKELLNQLKQTMLNKMDNYIPMRFNNDLTMQNVMNGITMTTISAIADKDILGTLSALSSLKLLKDYLKQYKELKELEKFIYFYENEENFAKFNKADNYIKLDKIVKYKLSTLCMKGEKIDCHNINIFSKKQLKKINECANKLEI
mgnify:FL=1